MVSSEVSTIRRLDDADRKVTDYPEDADRSGDLVSTSNVVPGVLSIAGSPAGQPARTRG
jgi:hypothetical protein